MNDKSKSVLNRLKIFFRNDTARKHPVKSLLKLIFLQTYHFITHRPFQFALVTGARAFVYPHSSGISSFYYFDLPDYREQKFLLDWINPGEFFIDIGANAGGWSLLIAGMGANVYAFEPIPSSFRRLTENILLNPGFDSLIRQFNIGLSSRNGYSYFTEDRDTGNRLIANSDLYSGRKITIEVRRLDEVEENLKPDYIKIDVEGHELEVIKGAINTLKQPNLKALIIETFRRANYNKPELQEMEEILDNYGFYPFQYHPEGRQLARLIKKNDGGQNTIYARPEFFQLK